MLSNEKKTLCECPHCGHYVHLFNLQNTKFFCTFCNYQFGKNEAHRLPEHTLEYLEKLSLIAEEIRQKGYGI